VNEPPETNERERWMVREIQSRSGMGQGGLGLAVRIPFFENRPRRRGRGPHAEVTPERKKARMNLGGREPLTHGFTEVHELGSVIDAAHGV